MKKVIIAGGSGFIGSKLSQTLVASGYEVVILTRNPSGKKQEDRAFHMQCGMARPRRAGRRLQKVLTL